jgi:hypothetical protein
MSLGPLERLSKAAFASSLFFDRGAAFPAARLRLAMTPSRFAD